MADRYHLALPLMSSVIYVFGSLWVRRAADLGVGVWRTTFVSNAISALFFAPLALFGGSGQPLDRLWQPAALAILLVAGQLLGFLALTRGDVTVATPVLGAKTIMVALLTTAILGTPVSMRLWCAAILSSGAITLLSRTGGGAHRRVGLTVGTGLAAAAVFALFDVCVQKWAPAWGPGRLLPLVMGFGALFSVAFVPHFRQPLRQIPRPAWRPLIAGSMCISVQGILLISTVAFFGDATSVNIVYSVRSLWTVVAVWWIGHWFRNAEQHLGRRVLGWRLLGAALMSAAVVLAVV